MHSLSAGIFLLQKSVKNNSESLDFKYGKYLSSTLILITEEIHLYILLTYTVWNFQSPYGYVQCWWITISWTLGPPFKNLHNICLGSRLSRWVVELKTKFWIDVCVSIGSQELKIRICVKCYLSWEHTHPIKQSQSQSQKLGFKRLKQTGIL